MQDSNLLTWFFLGALPPPLGGVTIFAKRKVATWRACGKQVVQLDVGKLSPISKVRQLFRLLFAGRNSGIYVNDLSGFNLAAAGFNIGGAKIFLHDHNYNLGSMTGFRGWLLRRCLSRCDEIYFDGVHSRENYIQAGFMREDKKYSFSSPFIKPDPAEREAIVSRYPAELFAFLDAHSPVIGANAFKIVLDDSGVDLYGVDMTLDLLESLRKTYPDSGVVFAVAVDHDSEYVQGLKQAIRDKGLAEHFLLMIGADELWPFFGMVDVFVRPTSTDGYGISVAEAIFSGTPAVASDVCKRHEKAVLFQARNQADLEEKVRQLLNNADLHGATRGH
jgi:glycosyltransferase involved in cell wall biosynthesis